MITALLFEDNVLRHIFVGSTGKNVFRVFMFSSPRRISSTKRWSYDQTEKNEKKISYRSVIIYVFKLSSYIRIFLNRWAIPYSS